MKTVYEAYGRYFDTKEKAEKYENQKMIAIESRDILRKYHKILIVNNVLSDYFTYEDIYCNMNPFEEIETLKFTGEDEIKEYVNAYKLANFDEDFEDLTYSFDPNEKLYVLFPYMILDELVDFIKTVPYPITHIMSLKQAFQFKIDFDKFCSKRFIDEFSKEINKQSKDFQ